jgi:cytochrome P450 family 135
VSVKVGVPPGPPYPRALQTVGWGLRPMPFMEGCRERYGDMFTLKVAQEGTWVFLADPEHIKQVFTGDPHVFHAGEGNSILEPLLGQHSVLLLDEERHMSQRKLMLPSFHGERMQRYGDLMAEVAERELESWPAREPIELLTRMQEVTLEVIMRAVFGVRDADRLDQLRNRIREMLEWGTRPQNMIAFAVMGPGRASRRREFIAVRKPVDDLLFEEIRARRTVEDLESRDDILSLLVQARHENGEPMSDEELRDELMTLLVAGHETTATALSWAIERLIRHEGMQERLAEEADAGESDFADAVAKETLRLRPVLPIVVRKLTEPVEIGGYELPAGVSVTPCIYLVHRREDVYPEPRRFRPERFLEQPAGTYTWIPFGGGVRRCLGASFALFEMRVVLQTVFERLAIRPAEPRAERPVRRTITFKPERGTEVVVEPRSKTPTPTTAEPSEVAA